MRRNGRVGMGGNGLTRHGVGLAVAAALTVAAATPARAQTIGIGPRVVVVKGTDSLLQDPNGTGNTKLTGGFIRLIASKHVGVEVSMDYRSTTDTTGILRVRSTPIQATGLFYLVRSTISPYASFGIGWYKNKYEALNGGTAILTSETSQTGYHTGFGGELMLGRHASVFVDYRYMFVNVDGAGGIAGGLASAFSLTSLVNMLNTLNSNGSSTNSSSHLGSTWTTGFTLYF
jgi:hypothetical protein